DRLHPLEGELDLPAQTIERGELLDRKLRGGERGQKDEMVGAGESPRIGAALVLPADALRLGACPGAGVGGLADDRQAQIERLEAAARLVHANGQVEGPL